MAVATVSANNTRVAVATIATDTGTWGNDGGGGGVSDEPDIVYQTTTAQSRKVSTSVIGRSYTHGSGTDMDGTPASTAHYIAKIQATNSAALLSRASPALHMKVGSSSGNYHTYYLFGNDNYPPRGGWQIIAIAPSVSGYAAEAGDTGTPNDSSVLFWSLLGDFSATSKSENVVIDAIDVGLGLALVGGDGVSTDAEFDDFVSFDEGTSGNRYGYVYTEGPVLYCTGQIAIGQNSSATSTLTEFNDTGKVLVWTNGLVTTGFHRLLLDIATASTTITMANCSFFSQGQEDNDGDRGYTTTEDSRTILEVTGTLGTVTMTSAVIDNFASIILNSDCELSGSTITNSGDVTADGADLTGTTHAGCTCPADTSAVTWNVATDPSGLLDNMTIAKGAAAHHAIEFGTTAPLTINLTGMTFTGFNATDAQNDSTFHVLRTSGTVTINVSGSTGNLSYKSAGATVNIVENPVAVTVTVLDNTGADLQNARVLVETSNGTGPYPFEESVTITRVSSTASVAHTGHGLANNDKVVIEGADQLEYNGVHTISNVTTNAYDYTVSGAPTSPATGTITSSFAVLEGLTDVNGEITASKSYSTDQPIKGVVRKSSASPYFKSAGFTGTVDTATGFTNTVQMIIDE